MKSWAKSKSYPVGVTLPLADPPEPTAGMTAWQRRQSVFDLNRRLRKAYIENVGHEPPPPRNAAMQEQFLWPHAKRRKYNRLTLEQVAMLDTLS